MSEKGYATAVSALTALAAVLCLHGWLARDPTADFAASMPGLDDPYGRKERLAKAERVTIGEFFGVADHPFAVQPAPTSEGGMARHADGTPMNLSASWPHFRGPYYDNLSREDVRLTADWGAEGPPVLWSLDLGEGHAGAAVHRGCVYILDYDEAAKADVLRCHALLDGVELWRRWYRVQVKRNHGMSRTVPAVTDEWVVTIGPKCHVMCVRRSDGELLWSLDMAAHYGTTVPGWYTGQCPLIDNGLAVLAPGGTNVLMLGVDCATGQTVWSTPNPGNWQMSHASITPMTLAGRKLYVYCAIGATVGVAADGPARGTILWQTPEWDPAVIAPSPVVLEDGRVFLTAGYAAGNMMIKVSEQNGAFSVQTLYRKKPKEGLASEQHIPLYYEGHLFSVQPKDAGQERKQLVCYTPDGTLVWASGKEHRFGIGPFMVADGKFLILDDNGVLTMAEATTKGYVELAQAQVLDGHDSWGPFALVDGLLLLRDSKRMVCLDLRERAAGRGTDT
ncbi:MAG: PQQ-like beta-propeller repeat protein [Kiritimatiellae bacterium]|nr:PQQ-like beta-propeller repeat protein [Kiritimatiellia bacterium]